MKTFEECYNEVAKRVLYDSFDEWIDKFNGNVYDIRDFLKKAAELYAKEVAIEAVKLARYQMGDISGSLEPNPYTEQEILEKLKL